MMANTDPPWSMNHGWCIEAEYIENQELCCAAPDLLEALTELYNHTKNDYQIAALNIQAKNAIDKAVGKE
jgi:hypothetical protein